MNILKNKLYTLFNNFVNIFSFNPKKVEKVGSDDLGIYYIYYDEDSFYLVIDDLVIAGVNKYRVRCGTSLRFWENKGWINEQDPYGWFQWYCRYYYGRRINSDASETSRANKMNAVKRANEMSEVSEDERQIKRWLGIINRSKGILVKMMKDKGTKFDDFSVSPKIRQILLHWGYELVESECQ